MKKLHLLSFLFLSLLLAACSSDDDSTDNDDDGTGTTDDNPILVEENYLMYGDTEYELKTGSISNYGSWNGVYLYDIIFATTNATLEDGDFVPEDEIFSGILFEIQTDNAEDLTVGTYPFSLDNPNAGHVSYAEAVINYNHEEDNEDAYREIDEGTVEIIQNGPNYKITFDCITINDVEISGHYEGTLIYEDLSEEEDGSTERMKAPKKSSIFKNKK